MVAGLCVPHRLECVRSEGWFHTVTPRSRTVSGVIQPFLLLIEPPRPITIFPSPGERYRRQGSDQRLYMHSSDECSALTIALRRPLFMRRVTPEVACCVHPVACTAMDVPRGLISSLSTSMALCLLLSRSEWKCPRSVEFEMALRY